MYRYIIPILNNSVDGDTRIVAASSNEVIANARTIDCFSLLVPFFFNTDKYFHEIYLGFEVDLVVESTEY